MRTKNFHDYLSKRLDAEEIAQIERQAQIELEIFTTLQNDIAEAVAAYMEHEGIGFNELVRRLDISPSQVAKIQRGEANLTLATMAHLFALMHKYPRFDFKDVA